MQKKQGELVVTESGNIFKLTNGKFQPISEEQPSFKRFIFGGVEPYIPIEKIFDSQEEIEAIVEMYSAKIQVGNSEWKEFAKKYNPAFADMHRRRIVSANNETSKNLAIQIIKAALAKKVKGYKSE